MPKSYKFILAILVVLLGVAIYMEARGKKKVDWEPTYSIRDKIPLGSYIFYHSLKDKTDSLTLVNQPPYEFLQDSTHSGTYFFLANSLILNKTALNKLLAWVKMGNTVFVSAHHSNLFNADTLRLQHREKVLRKSLVNYPEYTLSNPDLKTDSAFRFKHNSGLGYFKKIDTLNQVVLGEGHLKSDSLDGQKGEVNFVEVPWGKGRLFLHSSPEAFSNYFLLSQQNYRYVERALAYIDAKDRIFYDVYFDPTYQKEIGASQTSPLYVLFGNKYLKWGYYFIIIGAVLFILFEGKRKQQAIKVVPPLRNRAYDYARTIAGMYLDQKDHTSIARKKINQFLNFVRQELRTSPGRFDDNFINRLVELTDNSEEDIEDLLKVIQNLQQKENISKSELLLLNKKINYFKANC